MTTNQLLLRSAGALALWLCCLSCASTAKKSAMPDLKDWHQVMEEVVGPGFDEVLVPESGKDSINMDYARVESTATEMANALALGHGRLEEKRVPGFADMARNTEAWLLEISEQAALRKADQVQRLVAQGETGHCAKCHDAADEAR